MSDTNDKPAFRTWKFAGTAFIAFPCGDHVAVMDEHGGNYGGWQTVEKFREQQAKGGPLAKPFPDSVVRLIGQVLRTEARNV